MSLPGALVQGWSAVVVDRLLHLHLRRYLAVMTGEQRAELEQTRRAVRMAADLATLAERLPLDDAAEAGDGDVLARWITTDEAARRLGVSERRVRQLALVWEATGGARKRGPAWRIDEAVVIRSRRRSA